MRTGPDPDTMHHLEAQLVSLRETIDALKGSKTKAKAKAEPSKSYSASRQPSSSYPAKTADSGAAPRRQSPKNGASKKGGVGGVRRQPFHAYVQLTLEEKMSETIQNLEGSDLEDAIQIIHDE